MFKQKQVKYLGRQQNSQLFGSKTASADRKKKKRYIYIYVCVYIYI